MDTLAIIKRIEIRLTELGMSKAEFYEQSGISSASYSQWNTGKYNPSKVKLQKAADVLGLDVDFLCYGVTKKENSPSELVLTEGEKDLLELFRLIPVDRQPEALELLRVTLKMLQKP